MFVTLPAKRKKTFFFSVYIVIPEDGGSAFLFSLWWRQISLVRSFFDEATCTYTEDEATDTDSEDNAERRLSQIYPKSLKYTDPHQNVSVRP